MVNIKQDRYMKEEIKDIEIEKENNNFPPIKNKDKTIELKFLGKSISFKWWF